jgi:hypothetical protein
MLEYVAYVLLGAVMVGGLLYVTLSPEMEDARKPKGHDPSDGEAVLESGCIQTRSASSVVLGH